MRQIVEISGRRCSGLIWTESLPPYVIQEDRRGITCGACNDYACHELIILGSSGNTRHANVEYSRWWAGAVSVARKNRLAAPYGGGWSRGKERRSVVYGGSGNAGTPPVLSHSIASSRSASTTSTQPMTASTLSSSVSLLPQFHPVRESG